MASPNIYTIPPGADFLKSLVQGLKTQLGVDLPRALILLPTRRACQNLRDAFLNDSGDGKDLALLLPDIRPLAEVEEEELSLSAGGDFLREVAALPRAIDPLRRQMLLATLVDKLNLPGMTRAQAFMLAGDLGRLIDDALIEDCLFDNLQTLVPEEKDYAQHWKNIVTFLQIITHQWPQILKDEQAIDAVDRRQRLTQLLIKHWAQNPPDYPIIAAGSTGSQRVTGDLLKVISRLPKGAVILPGLDQHLEESGWEVLEPSHPQYLMARLLKKLEVEREDVRVWPHAVDGLRAVLLSEVMRPSEATDQWRFLRAGEIAPEAWNGLEVIEATQEQEEAFIAALMLRYTAEGTGTAALVTPDRALAKRVAALMRRWNIELDDSAGRPMSETPAGSHLSLLLDLNDANLRPSQLMAFFKHPFAGVGLERDALRHQARQIETEFFRDSPRGRGLATWIAVMKRNPAFEPFVELLENLHAPLKVLDKTVQGFSQWLKDFEKVSEKLTADKDMLWREREGEVLAELFESLANAAENFSCNYSEFAEIFKQALRDCAVRRAWGQHPRLAILGLLEARLLRFDHVILAGLNEGTWPTPQNADPWMSPAMRVDLGCADPDQRIGQTAHDFMQQVAGPRVSLIRSQRKGEAPTVPSRWLRRLEAVRELLGAKIETQPWATWARAADFSATLEPCDAPAVRVPHAALPQKLSPSAIEMWMRDPYAFYARHILGLEAQGALDAEFTVRERGTLIHRALEKLAKTYVNEWPEAAMGDFTAFVRKGLIDYGCPAEEREILSARIDALAREYWLFEATRRNHTTTRMIEAKADLAMQVDDYTFHLTARADRMDVLGEGGLSILDYKTSALPTKTERESVLKPQLYIEAILADEHAFADTPKIKTVEIAYVHFDQNNGEVDQDNLDLPEGAVAEIHKPGLINFIRAFLQEDARFRATPRPQWLDPSPDYARLARVAEWSKGAVTQEEGDA